MKNTIKNSLIAGLLAGVLDGIAAVVFLGKMNAEKIFRFIASGVFGKSAFAGGNEMMVYGIVFHFLIAITVAFLYNATLNKHAFFANNKIIGGLLYGIFIWVIMNLIVLPISNTPDIPFNFMGMIKGVSILMVCVGLPIALLSKPYETVPVN